MDTAPPIFHEAISKLGFSVEIKAEPSINPQAYFKYVEELRRGLNADIGRKDFFEMASNLLLMGIRVSFQSRNAEFSARSRAISQHCEIGQSTGCPLGEGAFMP